MATIFALLSLLIGALLTFVVLIQNSKGGGLSSAFGASNISSMVGAQKANQDIEKVTWYLAAALMLVAFFANIAVGTDDLSNDGSRMSNQIESNNFAPTTNTNQIPSSNQGTE